MHTDPTKKKNDEETTPSHPEETATIGAEGATIGADGARIGEPQPRREGAVN